MKKEKLSFEDANMIRGLVDFPGGLELHIGVGIGEMLPCAAVRMCMGGCMQCYLEGRCYSTH